MKYRITVDNMGESTVEALEVDAPDLASAIFAAGMQMACNGNPVGQVLVIKAEVPAGWQEVKLP